MRNHKVIHFDEFSCICKYKKNGNYEELCDDPDKDEDRFWVPCCASNCGPWRKMNKKKLSVVKNIKIGNIHTKKEFKEKQKNASN